MPSVIAVDVVSATRVCTLDLCHIRGGHVMLDLAKGTGTITFSGGTGTLRDFHATAAVSADSSGLWHWDGTFNFGSVEAAAGATVRQKAKIVQGIESEKAKAIVRTIKDAKLKVQVSIQSDQVRVVGRSKDDLQKAMALVREQDYGLPLQFTKHHARVHEMMVEDPAGDFEQLTDKGIAQRVSHR